MPNNKVKWKFALIIYAHTRMVKIAHTNLQDDKLFGRRMQSN